MVAEHSWITHTRVLRARSGMIWLFSAEALDLAALRCRVCSSACGYLHGAANREERERERAARQRRARGFQRRAAAPGFVPAAAISAESGSPCCRFTLRKMLRSAALGAPIRIRSRLRTPRGGR